MTQDEIIEMARQAGMSIRSNWAEQELEAFAKLVAAKAIREHAMYEVQRLGQEIEQEPVALVIDGVLVKSAIPEKFTGHLYTHPQHTWVGLTNEERMDILLNLHRDKILSHMDTALAIEAKLKEKNT